MTDSKEPDSQGSKNSVFQNSLSYLAVNLIKSFGFFLILPIYTRFLTLEEYGLLLTLNSLALFLGSLFTLSLRSTVVRFFFEHDKNSIEHKKMYGTIFLSIFSLLLFGVLVLFLSKDMTLIKIFELSKLPFEKYYLYLFLLMLFEPFFHLIQSYMVAKEDVKKFSIQQLGQFFFIHTIGLYCVIQLGMKEIGILWGQIGGHLFFFLYSMLYLLRNFKPCIDGGVLKKCLSYSLPLVPTSVVRLLPGVVDKVFLNNMISVASSGGYGIGGRVGSVFDILSTNFSKAYAPWFFKQSSRGELKSSEVKELGEKIVLMFCLIGVMASFLSEPLFDLVFPASYKVGWLVLPILAFHSIFNLIKTLFLTHLQNDISKIKYATITTYFYVPCMLILSYFSIKAFGLIGPAVGLLGARFLSSFVMLYYAKTRTQTLDFSVVKLYFYALFALSISLLSYLEFSYDSFFKVFISLLALGAFVIVGKDEIQVLVKKVLR
ncbi:MAG: oligosaccharide flippase family protein [Bacteriovoracaceae bacterium]